MPERIKKSFNFCNQVQGRQKAHLSTRNSDHQTIGTSTHKLDRSIKLSSFIIRYIEKHTFFNMMVKYRGCISRKRPCEAELLNTDRTASFFFSAFLKEN